MNIPRFRRAPSASPPRRKTSAGTGGSLRLRVQGDFLLRVPPLAARPTQGGGPGRLTSCAARTVLFLCRDSTIRCSGRSGDMACTVSIEKLSRCRLEAKRSVASRDRPPPLCASDDPAAREWHPLTWSPLQLEAGKLPPPVPALVFAAGGRRKGARGSAYVHKIRDTPKVLVDRFIGRRADLVRSGDPRKLTQQVVGFLNRFGRESRRKPGSAAVV